MPTCGVVFVHSTPLAVCPHLEWAVSRALTVPVSLQWSAQPLDPAARRAEFGWTGRPGTGALIAGELKQWPMVRFEVTEEPSPGNEGARYSYTPDLGVFHAVTGVHGDIMIPEDRIKAAVVKSALGEVDLEDELRRLVGGPWDDELEPFRYAGDGAPVRWLHQVV